MAFDVVVAPSSGELSTKQSDCRRVHRGPVRHAPAHADDIPGVCQEPSLLAASADGVQAEPAVRATLGEAGE